ncbi:MAG: hypothetical protein ACYDCK_07045 [Thermoplasmatota archaeon]
MRWWHLVEVLALVALLVSSGLSGLAPLAGAVPLRSASRPVTAPGDWWSSLTSVRSDLGQTTEVETNTTVVRNESATYHAVVVPAVRTDSVSVVKRTIGAGATATQNWAWTNSTIETAPDGGELARASDVTVTLNGKPQTRTSQRLEWDSPCYQVDWPLFLGKTWTVRCAGWVRSGATLARYYDNSTYWVNDTGTVQNRAGDFDTFVIENGTAGGRGARQHYAPLACAVVRIEARSASGNVTALTDVTGYHCASTSVAPTPAPQTTTRTPAVSAVALVALLGFSARAFRALGARSRRR